MINILADTHTILWTLFDPNKLLPLAHATIASITIGRIYISSITLIEINYIQQKKNFPYTQAYSEILKLVEDPREAIQLLPIGISTVTALEQIPRLEIPDMPDRIIAATAVEHQLPFVSADEAIRSSPTLRTLIPVLW